ncbi:glycosyltransferase family 4 protein [Arcobacter peruensis]|uniref:glycosyltransferase family 4 protein n=1 Tax=Arcobacter peruensis TaxID=2320140 RepID=UPI000F08E076|nr:glycosyltransferase family 4 protein [Arcobacter peruensis]
MRVIQLIPNLNEGGVERGVVDLNKEFIKQGIDNIVISNGGRLVNNILSDGGKHISFDIASKNIFTIIPRVIKFKKILKELNPDILHVRSRVPGWLVFFANKSLNIKVVSTVHGFNSISSYSKIMVKADRIICGSQFMIEHIKKYYNANENKITLISRGMDEEYFNSLNLDKVFINELIKKYNLEDSIILSQIARITHWKDQETTIKAISLLKEKYPNIKLLLVGSYSQDRESYYNSLVNIIKEHHLENNIVFLGFCEKIKEILSITNINISSSNKPETFGRANVEGMFLGVPLVATNIGATSDYIIEEKTGFFFNPNDEKDLASKIKKTINYTFDKDSIINFAKENFTLTTMVKKNLEVYKKVLGD